MKIVFHISRCLLGLAYVIFGINGFGPWLPVPEMPPGADAFMQALIGTGYMLPFWKITEILTGICFLANRFVLPASIMAMPVSLNILAFHLFLDPGNLLIGIVVFGCNLVLLIVHRQQLKPLFQAKSTIS